MLAVLVAVGVVGVGATPALARTPVKLPATGHVSRALAKTIKPGTLVKVPARFAYPDYYPSEGGPIAPPYPCQSFLAGWTVAYLGLAWECHCDAPPNGCAWRLSADYDGRGFPDWWTFVGPTGFCVTYP